jgi:hypothetical protein
MSTDPNIPVFTCFKWGEHYSPRYTNVLYRALCDVMKRPFRLVCITDHADGLLEGIEVAELPDFALAREDWNSGMWPKLSAFKPGMFEPGTPVIMIDVDVVVLRDLGPLVDHVLTQGGLHIIHDWPDTLERWFPRWWIVERRSNSSCVGFIAGEQDHIWEEFHTRDYSELRKDTNDQDFIHRTAINRQDWPESWMLSFKKSLAFHVPFNFVRPIRRPKSAYVVAFHGRPDPEDMAGKPFQRWGSPEKFGYFPVRWIKDYWSRHSAGI